MFSLIKKWASFVRFSHTVFALPFALAAMLVAARDNRGWPGWKIFGLILAAMVCARTCAMAFNRIVDHKFDALNPRTANRHLPSGQISLASAISLCILSAAGLIAASYFLNPLVFLPFASGAGAGLFLFADEAVHGLHARFSRPRARAGARRRVASGEGRKCFSFGNFANDAARAAVVTLWLVGFDIIYALQDYEFDRSHGLRSLVVAWGPQNALTAAFLAHMIMCGLLLGFGLLCRFRIAYLIGWLIILGCLTLEHWIARRRSLNWINVAFFRLNALVGVVFLVVVAAEVIFQGGFKLR